MFEVWGDAGSVLCQCQIAIYIRYSCDEQSQEKCWNAFFQLPAYAYNGVDYATNNYFYKRNSEPEFLILNLLN